MYWRPRTFSRENLPLSGYRTISDGADQNGRFPAPLRDHAFDVDERSLENLLASTAEFAATVEYRNLRDEKDGTWKDLFDADGAVVMAEIISSDVSALEAKFLGDPLYTNQFIARRIGEWHLRLQAATDEPSQILGQQLREVASRDSLSRFHTLWGLPTGSQNVPDGHDPRADFYSLIGVIQQLKSTAREYLPRSLRSGQHDPAMALVIAFGQLFRKAQDRLNLFTSRHRDFYYRDVLGMVAKAQDPDSTFLVFETQPGVAFLEIPAGTAFSAGKSVEGEEIFYQSESTLNVTDAQVRSVQALYCPRTVKPETDYGYFDGLRSAELQTGRGLSSSVEATIGFAVTSTALLLSQGNREVVVTVRFQIPEEKAELPGSTFRRELLGVPEDPHNEFARVVCNAFRLSVTTAEGWTVVPRYGATLVKEGGDSELLRLSISLKLGPEFPAVAPYAAGTHGDGYDTALPVLKFCLNPQAYIYGYSLFSDLLVHDVAITSHVADVTHVAAWNQFGQLDPSKPFQPFGPLPSSNSYLIVGNRDCAVMNLTSLRLDFEWGDLPRGADGFSEHYKGYETHYRNDSFQVGLSLLRDGRWRPLPAEEQIAVPLFDSDPENGSVRARSIHIDLLRYFEPLDPAVTEERFQYGPQARSGFFRLSLTAPQSGFGHAEYPTLLTGVISENARRLKWLFRKPAPLPNAPYTPLINKISLHYSATSHVRLNARDASPFEDKLYRVHPFGTVERVDTSRPKTLLPIFENDGNLFIGFSATDPSGLLTLLFQVGQESGQDVSPELTFSWQFLAQDAWKPFFQRRILSDTTNGFLCSGIVTLDIPDEITNGNSIMPKELYWLKVSAPNGFSVLRRVQAVWANAGRVREVLAAIGGPARVLPGGSIRGPASSIAQLRSVSQPLASEGGQEPETSEQTITRTSERLRHKFRAVTAWDYERLVLDQFPDVFKVKCFTASTLRGVPLAWIPGSVMVVTVPYQSDPGVFCPMLNTLRIKQIREFLQRTASGVVEIDVRNPVYERLVVRCSVKLKDEAGRQEGRLIKQLNAELVAHMSPWKKTGRAPRFGWSFQTDEIKAFVGSRPYVESVTQLSMLHIFQDEQGNFTLNDTARPPVSNIVSWRYPWSIAVPHRRNMLRVIEEVGDDTPVETGIGELEIEDLFIVTSERP